MLFPLQARGTFGRWGRQNVHQTVARAPFHMKIFENWHVRSTFGRSGWQNAHETAARIGWHFKSQKTEGIGVRSTFNLLEDEVGKIHWFIDSLVACFFDTMIHWLLDSLIHWFADALIHWLTYWIIGVLIFDSLIHWFIDWFLIAISFFSKLPPRHGLSFSAELHAGAAVPTTTGGAPCFTAGSSSLALQHWQQTQQARLAPTMPRTQAAQPNTTK